MYCRARQKLLRCSTRFVFGTSTARASERGLSVHPHDRWRIYTFICRMDVFVDECAVLAVKRVRDRRRDPYSLPPRGQGNQAHFQPPPHAISMTVISSHYLCNCTSHGAFRGLQGRCNEMVGNAKQRSFRPRHKIRLQNVVEPTMWGQYVMWNQEFAS